MSGSGIIGPKSPVNTLVQSTPANTLERCRGVIRWLAHIEQPFSGEELAAAEADILNLVGDALEHAEEAFRNLYRLDDDPETQDLAGRAGP
jgi:hypothetical protein